MERNNDVPASTLLDNIIAQTFSRNTETGEREFVNGLGFTATLTEENAVRVSKINLLIEITKELLTLKEHAMWLEGILETMCDKKEEVQDCE